MKPRRLYDTLTKPQATALFLLRTEVIGLNKWLASRLVPGIDKGCPCGWRTQTAEHIVFFCPRYDRTTLAGRLRSESLPTTLGNPATAVHVAKWFIQQRVLQQFSVARDLEEEDRTGYSHVQELSRWAP